MAQVAILVQTITSEFLKWTGRCCLYPFAVEWYSSCWLGTVSLTNLSVLQPKNPLKRWSLPGFLFFHVLRRRDSTVPTPGDARQVENIQPLSHQAQCSHGFWVGRSIGCLAPSVSFLPRTLSVWCSLRGRLCFYELRAAVDATMHFYVVTYKGHTDPVKNGDAFEILGMITILTDRKVTVKRSDNLS